MKMNTGTAQNNDSNNKNYNPRSFVEKSKHIRDKYIKTYPAAVCFYNFVLMLAIYYLCRIFFLIVNKNYFSDITFSHFLNLLKGGLQFDISALLYTNAIYLAMQIFPFKFRLNRIYQSVAKWIFIAINSLAITANCIDIIYFRFTSRRTTSTVFTEFQNENNLLKIIGLAMVEYWYVTLFAAFVIFILYKCYCSPATAVKKVSSLKSKVTYYALHTLLMCAVAFVTVIGMRGGIVAPHRPITLSNANAYVNKSVEAAIVLNTPFCIVRTLDKKVYKNPQYFDSEEEMAAVYSPLHSPSSSGEFKPLNVVIFITESFGKEYSGFFNRHLDNGTYKGYTPFMDSLYNEGLTFEYSYSNGRKSIDAMPSILSSIPMIIEPFISTSYSINEISSMAAVLKEKGYYSAFFHGAHNGSMGFLAYAKSAGFDDYFGLTEYGNTDLDGMWAVWDEEFLQYYAEKMGELKQPFVTAVFTATSHHPFKIPKRYEGHFPEGDKPIHKCIGYTDYAIRQFFNKMKQYEWFDNTLFVITADHTNMVTHEEYFTDVNAYSVPILFYHPGSDLKGLKTEPVQQIDIMPSILGYLNYDQPYFAYGQDIFSTNENDKFTVNYSNQLYQFLQHDYFLQFDGQKVKSFYNYKTDTLLKNNLAGKVEEQQEMEHLLKAIIQQYVVRMTENRLTLTKP
ncbi:MAG: sulfatase-like hydrolase/transferase [Prevotellaceae bacterium]|jgi:phosphoglycerol transferase MdoB-like AlkP superfamily enzyme|nr:sulfatase-like hydrolase/transferase [Prevotellaceae bacterium]